MRLYGEIPPVVTVFKENGETDYEAMFRHADYLIGHGVQGLAYLGTSGEFCVMTLDQRLELIRKILAYVDGRVPVFIGIGDTCLENTLALADQAAKSGASALLAVIPYFNVYGEENVEAYYHALAGAVRLPLILYNFPALTGFDLNPDLVRRLALSEGNVLGIKDTVPDEAHLLAMLDIKKEKPDFSVFCAYETQALNMGRAGIDGFINATGNFAPEFTRDFLDAAEQHDEEGMELAAHRMEQAAQIYQYGTPLLLAVKEAVYQILGIRGAERLPGLSLSPEKKEKVREVLHTIQQGKG